MEVRQMLYRDGLAVFKISEFSLLSRTLQGYITRLYPVAETA